MKMPKKIFLTPANDPNMELNLPPADDAYELHDLLNVIDRPVNTNDYEIPVKPVKSTTSVVEVHKPQLALPDAEEIVVQNMHVSAEIEIENKV